MKTTHATPPEDPELAQLIERHLDGDPAATVTLDARLASDPNAALAFANANRMEALLATHHQRAHAPSRLTPFIRPLAWLAAAASIGLLAWVAFRPTPEASPTVESSAPADDTPRRRILSPLSMEGEPTDEEQRHRLSAAEIEAKAARFFIPEIDVSASSPDEALRQIEAEFRKITSRHGDWSAAGIRFESKGYDRTGAQAPSHRIRIASGGGLETLLAAVALQSAGQVRYADGEITIERVRATSAISESAPRTVPFSENLLPFLTGNPPSPQASSDSDYRNPFGESAMDLIVPEIVFNEATPEEAFAFLRIKSQELDPSGNDINLVFNRPAILDSESHNGGITLNLRDVPIGVALESVVELAGLKMVDQNGVILIASPEDPLFSVDPVDIPLPGLVASYDSETRLLALEGDPNLTEAGVKSVKLLNNTPQQILVTFKIVCAAPADLETDPGTDLRIDMFLGSQIIRKKQRAELIEMAKVSNGSLLKNAPSVVTRALQPTKIEITREMFYRVAHEDGELSLESAPEGWTLELKSSLIGEATFLTGTIDFSSIEAFPSARNLDFHDEKAGHPQYQNGILDSEACPIGNPLHKWTMDFEAELLDGQDALLDFMDLEDGRKVYVLVVAERIDPSGQRIYPASEE